MARKKQAPAAPIPPARVALFQAVKESPDDEAVRLVLADWLEEHGDEADRARAELIRVQCEFWAGLARAADEARRDLLWRLLRKGQYNHSDLSEDLEQLVDSDSRLTTLKAREWELIRWYEKAWLGTTSPCDLAEWICGMPVLGPQRLRALEGDAFAESPGGLCLAQLRLGVLWSGEIGELSRCKLLDRTIALELDSSEIGAEGLAELLSSPNLKGLRRLELDAHLTEAELRNVLKAGAMQRVTHLRLPGRGIARLNAGGLAALGETPWLDGLQVLSLAGVKVGPDASGLASCRFLRGLDRLDLCNSHIGTKGMEALAVSPHFRAPAMLDLEGNDFGPAGLRALLQAPGLENVAVLELGGNGLDDDEVAALATSPRLANLLVLRIDRRATHRSKNTFGPAGAEALASSPALSRLVCLDLRGTLIGEDGVRVLLGSAAHLKQLRKLLLHGVSVGEGLKAELRARFGKGAGI